MKRAWKFVGAARSRQESRRGFESPLSYDRLRTWHSPAIPHTFPKRRATSRKPILIEDPTGRQFEHAKNERHAPGLHRWRTPVRRKLGGRRRTGLDQTIREGRGTDPRAG